MSTGRSAASCFMIARETGTNTGGIEEKSIKSMKVLPMWSSDATT